MTSLLSSRASTETLVRAAKRGDMHAIETLITGDGPLRWMVQSIKRKADPEKVAERWEPMPEKGKPDEAEAAARLGILDALDRFDPELGVAFTTFAYPFIKGAVLAAIYHKVRRTSDAQPSPILVDLGLGVTSDEPDTSPGFEALMLQHDPGYGEERGYLKLMVHEERAAVRRFVDGLPDTQRTIIREIYFDGRSQKDLAADRGVSPQAISKTLNQALARGRECLDPISVAA